MPGDCDNGDNTNVDYKDKAETFAELGGEDQPNGLSAQQKYEIKNI